MEDSDSSEEILKKSKIRPGNGKKKSGKKEKKSFEVFISMP